MKHYTLFKHKAIKNLEASQIQREENGSFFNHDNGKCHELGIASAVIGTSRSMNFKAQILLLNAINNNIRKSYVKIC